MKPVVVVFIGGYLPGRKYGGPVTSIENFANRFCHDYDIRVICNDHDFKETKRYDGISDGWNKVGNALVYYTNEKYYDCKSFESIISEFRDNVMFFYLSGIYYIKMNHAAIRLSRKCHIPVILAPRGDLMKNTIAMKSKKKMIKKLVFLSVAKFTNMFHGVVFQATSDEEEAGLKNYLGITKERIFNVYNLPTISKEKTKLEKSKDALKVLFISRIMVKKNPLLAIQIIEQVNENYNIEFDIYGPKEDEDYWNECQNTIKRVNETKNNIKINYLGSLPPTKAKEIYGQYDCFLFPTVSENYGHVIVEAMFSDCPVILSKGTTPWDDYHNNGGFAIALSETKGFVNAIQTLAEMNSNEYQAIIMKNRKYTESKFQVGLLKQKYRKMIEQSAKSTK